MNNKTVSSPPPSSAFIVLTDEQRQQSLENAMAQYEQGQDVWVFGYGSLIWKPAFEFTEKRYAVLDGYHRELCLWSSINRGTPEHPGLVFALDNGGACQGMVFRIPAELVEKTMPELWQREMLANAYVPKWLNCSTSQGDVKALAFVMNHNHPSYVKEMPEDLLVKTIKTAVGTYGSTLEYVVETHKALKEHNIEDKGLEHVVNLVCG